MASEVGVVDIDPARVVEKGRLGPGQMIAVDTRTHEILRNDDLKRRYVRRQPYGDWLKSRMVHLRDSWAKNSPTAAEDATKHPAPVVEEFTLYQQQLAFGFTNEELKFVLEPMGLEGKEAVWSMGDDTPPAVLGRKARPLPQYFRQRFAQVTNPP